MVVAVVGAFSLYHLVRAVQAGRQGRTAILRAEANLSARRLDVTRADLQLAQQSFSRAKEEVSGLGVLAKVARHTPVVGSQVKASDVFADAGITLSQAGLRLVDAVGVIVNPSDEHLPVSKALDALRATHQSLIPGVAALDAASARLDTLHGAFLIGPLESARQDLSVRLPRIERQARSAETGLASLIAFAGGSGPRRYLFLSQNPDEVRPTGGYMGTYGVLTAAGGQLRLERYDAMENWTGPRPQADVPPDQVGPPFKYHDPPLRQTMGNVNNGPDWPAAAKQAAELWQKGGEAPVDGVISFTPPFLARILSVVGPVSIPSYGETVTAENLADRLDYQTHQAPPPPGTYRKDFVAVVAEAVMQRLLDAPASQWEPLGRVMGQAFDAREALAWSGDPEIAAAITQRGWDGAFPQTSGDFVFASEFEYAAKNGHGIRRVYDHHVTVGPDGSGRVTTKVTVTNTEPPSAISYSTLAYITMYGPEGGVLNKDASDAFGFPEPAMAGHPANGWFRAAAPNGGQTTLTVVWDVPGLVKRLADGSWRYDLQWMHLPAHKGDVVNLSFELPATWRWKGAPPPAQLSLDQDIKVGAKLVGG